MRIEGLPDSPCKPRDRYLVELAFTSEAPLADLAV
jgi:hypothetical protein